MDPDGTIVEEKATRPDGSQPGVQEGECEKMVQADIDLAEELGGTPILTGKRHSPSQPPAECCEKTSRTKHGQTRSVVGIATRGPCK